MSEDYDPVFSGSPEELDAILAGRGAQESAGPTPKRWSPVVTMAAALGVSLGLWAIILLLLG